MNREADAADPTIDDPSGAGPSPVAPLTAAAPLWVVGTLPASWAPIAAAFRQVLVDAGIDGTAIRVCTDTEDGLDARVRPGARVVAFVEGPAEALARSLDTENAGAPAEVLRAWRESALGVLRLARRLPDQCLVVDSLQAASHPEALLRAVARWHVPLGECRMAAVDVPVADPLGALLARELSEVDSSLAEAFQELRAECFPLLETAGGSESTVIETSGAVQRYRELLVVESECRDLKEHADAEGLARLRAELEAAREEGELLLLNLHEVQEELEHYYLRTKELESTGLSAGATSALGRTGGIVQLVHVRDAAPHRHLHLRLEQVQLAGRTLPAMDVRLLEHGGCPGLAVFSSGSEGSPLASWKATGSESGRQFMTLMPADPTTRPLLQRMGTADWQLVNQLTAVIHRHVLEDGWHLDTRWRDTASRLCRQLADMPPRLRYDAVNVHRVGSDGHELEIRFGRSSFGDRSLGDVRLHWRPGSNKEGVGVAGLRWLRPEAAAILPLSGWPIDKDSRLTASYGLPVGGGRDARGKLRLWRAMCSVDRELVLAVLDALPGATEHVSDAALPAGLTRAALLAAAQALHREARRTLATLQLRGVLRRLARRGQAAAE